MDENKPEVRSRIDLTESELETEIKKLTPIIETNRVAKFIVDLFQKELNKKRELANRKELKSKLGYSRVGLGNV